MIAVLLAMTLKEGAEVEQWLGQVLLLLELQGDQKTANAAVSIHKGVNRFELIVNESQADKEGQITRAFPDVTL